MQSRCSAPGKRSTAKLQGKSVETLERSLACGSPDDVASDLLKRHSGIVWDPGLVGGEWALVLIVFHEFEEKGLGGLFLIR